MKSYKNKTKAELLSIIEELKAGNQADIIPEQNLKPAALEDTVRWLTLISDNIPAHVAYVGMDDFKYKFVNSKFEESFGKPGNEIIGSHAKDIVGEANFKYARKYLDMVKSGLPASYESAFNFKQGSLWAKVNFVPDFDDKGKVKGFVVLTYDITDLKKTELVLNNQLKFETLITDLSSSFINLDYSQIDIELNKALKDIVEYFGAGRCLIIQASKDHKKFWSNHSYTTPDRQPYKDKTNINEQFKFAASQLKRGEIFRFSKLENLPLEAELMKQYYRKEGITSAIAIPIAAGGSAIGSLSISVFDKEHDWSEEFIKRLKFLGEIIGNVLLRKLTLEELRESEEKLKSSEEKYRALSDESLLGIMIFGSKPIRIIYANQKMEKITGYTVEELLNFTKQDIEKLTDPVTNRLIWKRFADRIAGKEIPSTYQIQGIRKNGEKRWLEVTSKKIELFGEPVAMTTSLDITEMKDSEQHQKKLEDQLRQSEKMQAIGQLAGGIAHDFNNQLAAIQTFSELIKEKTKSGSDPNSFADNILTTVRRSTDLTRQLLAFSRKGKYREVDVDIHSIINEVVTMLERSVDKKISIVKKLECGTPHTIGDPSQLQNAVLNLALNARDAMKNGGEIKITTDSIHLDEKLILDKGLTLTSGEYIQLCMLDSGTGMDEKTMRHIFEPFFTTKDPGKGTGMGLAAVYGTIKNHNGGISVKSNPGMGTTVTLYLPVIDKSDDSALLQESETQGKGKGNLLIVDDEKMVARSIQAILELFGFTVFTCGSGREAIDIYRNNWKSLDLVLIDMIMPEMNGKELFSKLKDINPDIRALILSGYSMDEEARTALKLGIKGFIEKPFTKDALLKQINEVLNT